MWNSYSRLRFSKGESKALQAMVLAVFGAVDYPLASCMLVHDLEIDFKWELVCKFDIMENRFCHCFNYLNAYAIAYIL